MRRPLLVPLLVLGLLLGLVGVSPAAQADGPSPKRVASGWLPYWMTSPGRPAGVTSAVQNADLFADVSPFWYSATAAPGGGVQVRLNPNFTNGASNVAWAMGQLKGAGLTVLPSIADGSGKGRMAATLADPGLRAKHVADIVALVTANGFDGIDLDYETFAFSDGSSSWAATQPNWTAFVNELAAALHAQGKQLAVTIPPPCNTSNSCGPRSGYWVYDIAGIGAAADHVRIMAYDYHVNGIGAIAPMPWVRSIVQYSASVVPSAKIQIGVPAYGRAWTRTDGGGYELVGTCPTDKNSSAYRSLTSMSSVSDADVAGVLASTGTPATAVQWDDAAQENWVYYDKKVTWTDGSGVSQTCTAKRVMWWVGPQGVLARTQLVGEFGLGAAAYWTVGGEDPAQWPLIRAYAQSLAPAGTDITAAGVPSTVFGAPVAVTATVTSQGAPLAGVTATLQFRPTGKKMKFTDVQAVATGPDGVATFTVQPPETGTWQVFVPADAARVEGVSAAFTTQVLSLVTAVPTQTRVSKSGRISVRAWARPAQPGQVLALQIKNGDAWKNVARAKANAKGRARLVASPPPAKGKYVYRVVAVGTRAILANASTEIPIRVTR